MRRLTTSQIEREGTSQEAELVLRFNERTGLGAEGQGGALDQSQDPEAGGHDAGIFQNKGKTSFSH